MERQWAHFKAIHRTFELYVDVSLALISLSCGYGFIHNIGVYK